MDDKIIKYIQNGITIDGDPVKGYKVFTIQTQWFKISSLNELTEEKFEVEIKNFKKREEIQEALFCEFYNLKK